jgi:hypothetical protein
MAQKLGIGPEETVPEVLKELGVKPKAAKPEKRPKRKATGQRG